MKSAAVVILNWNKADMTRQCLDQARRATLAPVQWIVVDNGSSEALGPLGDEVTLIRNTENLGFSGGVNAGMKHAFATGADHVWLLNNDAQPLPGALDALLAAARADSRIGLASAVIRQGSADESHDFFGGLWSPGVYQRAANLAEYAAWVAKAPDRIWLLGTALLVSRRLVERIGYFDEALFAYFEDNDISRRSAAAGFRNIMVPEAVVQHYTPEGQDNPSVRPPYYYYFMARNELKLLRKTGDAADPRYVYWLLRRSIRDYKALKGFPTQRQAILRGLLDGVLGRGGPYPGWSAGPSPALP